MHAVKQFGNHFVTVCHEHVAPNTQDAMEQTVAACLSEIREAVHRLKYGAEQSRNDMIYDVLFCL